MKCDCGSSQVEKRHGDLAWCNECENYFYPGEDGEDFDLRLAVFDDVIFKSKEAIEFVEEKMYCYYHRGHRSFYREGFDFSVDSISLPEILVALISYFETKKQYVTVKILPLSDVLFRCTVNDRNIDRILARELATNEDRMFALIDGITRLLKEQL